MHGKKKILVVEDDEFVSEFLKINLKDDGYEIIATASTGEEAIQLAKSTSPDLILMDIYLGTLLNGVATAEAISSYADVPIIYISDNVEPTAVESVPYGYLLKPINYDELKIAIQLAFYRYELEKKIKSYQSHLDHAQTLGNMGSWEWDIVNNNLIWSDQIFRIFGLKPQEFEPTYSAFLERIHPEDRKNVIDVFEITRSNKKPYDIEHRIILPDGSLRYVQEIGEADFDIENNAIRMTGTVIDISERKEADKKIERLAYYDDLTDLPNRRLFIDRLDVLIALSKRDNTKFAVLFIDLDGFKSVNDNYGHKFGDRLLKSVAKRIKSVFRESDTITRLGGDEFIALIKETDSPEAVKKVTEKLLDTINKPYTIMDEITIKTSASIGVAIYPDDGTNADDLLTNSDNAMYIAKNAGKNQIHFFNPDETQS